MPDHHPPGSAMTVALRRDLSRRQVEFLALGGTIGAGLFLSSGQALHMAGPALLPAYALCGLVVYVIARCLGELALADPRQGTFVNHIGSQLGPAYAFVSGWSYWITMIVVCMAELTAVGLLTHAWFPTLPQWIPAFVVLLLLFVVNQGAVRLFGEAEFWLALLKIVTITGFILLGLAALVAPVRLGLTEARLSNLWRFGGMFPTGLAGFLAILPIALFPFGGIELVSLAAAETADPQRTLPRAVNGLLLRVLVFYLGAMAALLVLLPWTRIEPGSSPFVLVLRRLDVPFAAGFLNLVLITAVTSSCNSILFGATRALRSLALDGGAPARWAEANRNGVPVRAAVVAKAALTHTRVLNYLLPAQIFGLLLQMTALVITVNWTLIVLAHLRYRRTNPPYPLLFPVPWTPWSNYLVFAFVLVVLSILATDRSARGPLLLAVLGFGALAIMARLRRRHIGSLS